MSQLTEKNILLMYSPGLKFTITIKQNNGKYSLKDFAYKIGVISEQISTREAWKHLQQNYYCRFRSGLIWTYVVTCETKFRLGFQNLENSTPAAWWKNLEKQNKSEKSLPFFNNRQTKVRKKRNNLYQGQTRKICKGQAKYLKANEDVTFTVQV